MILFVTRAAGNDFVSGATALGSVAVALYFTRFWVQSRDRLFVIFALAFVVFGASRVALLFARGSDFETWVYLLRLIAFLLILIGIVDKNRREP